MKVMTSQTTFSLLCMSCNMVQINKSDFSGLLNEQQNTFLKFQVVDNISFMVFFFPISCFSLRKRMGVDVALGGDFDISGVFWVYFHSVIS